MEEEALWRFTPVPVHGDLHEDNLLLERDRVVVRSNGEPTYLLPDIAYHRDKYQRGFEAIIDVLGADHIEQFPFVRAAVGVLGFDPERMELALKAYTASCVFSAVLGIVVSFSAVPALLILVSLITLRRYPLRKVDIDEAAVAPVVPGAPPASEGMS